jgi:hypothetical protein
VFARACQVAAEGIVSKKVDGTYRSGLCRVWIEVRSPAGTALCSNSRRFLSDLATKNGDARDIASQTIKARQQANSTGPVAFIKMIGMSALPP